MMSTRPPPSPLLLAIHLRDAALLRKVLSDPKVATEKLQRYITLLWNDQALLDDENKLQEAVECIRVLRQLEIPIDLSLLPDSVVSLLIKQLFLKKPSDAVWALQNMTSRSGIMFPFGVKDFIKIEMHICHPEESEAVYQCLKQIKILDETDTLYDKIINSYIEINSRLAIDLNAHLHANYKPKIKSALFESKDPIGSIYKFIIACDSPDSLDEYLNQPKCKDPNFILQFAVSDHALKCIALLLKRSQISDSVLIPMIHEKAMESDLLMTLALCKNDFEKTSAYLFYDDLFFPNNQTLLHDHLIAMLRFSPIESVDEMVNAYSNNNKQNKEILLQSYAIAKKEFFKHASNFSRYNTHILPRLAMQYTRNSGWDLKTQAKRDMDYGKERSALVDKLILSMKESTNEKPFIPTKTELLNLPASSNGSRIFAAILEKISQYNTQKNINHENSRLFSQLKKKCVTPVAGAYSWAQPLINAVFQYSRSAEIIKYYNRENINDASSDPFFGLYALSYKAKTITTVGTYLMWKQYQTSVTDHRYWEHGKLPLDSTMGDIENLIETMMKQPLQTQMELSNFYANAATLVWLIGNTTPLQRGSGTLAELTLTDIFQLRGLQAPILKSDFAQLDVLDITFPLDDYIKLFPYFCEPSTLPEHLRKPSFSHLSIYDQVVSFYKEINGSALKEEKAMTEQSTAASSTLPMDTSSSAAAILSATIKDMNIEEESLDPKKRPRSPS